MYSSTVSPYGQSGVYIPPGPQQQQQQQPPIPTRPQSIQPTPNPNTLNTDLTSTVISRLNITYHPGTAGKVDPTTTNPEYYNKIKLHQNRQELSSFETKADLYGIIVSLEHLENAFLRDAIPPSDYTDRCRKLLSQYKTWMDIHRSLINDNLQQFIKDSNLTCPAVS
eukprot:UN01997